MSNFRDLFLRACRGETVEHTPIWLMRQAGRYLPEYRAIREKHPMLEVCQTPELVTEVTLQPLKRFDLDAAILFSDITMPFLAMDVPFQLKEGVGPVVEPPIRSGDAIKNLPEIDAEQSLGFVMDSISLLQRELTVPLIGFAGAPFTLAAYMIEGKPSRDFKLARTFMYQEPQAWHQLMEVLTENTKRYLVAQAKAGVQALQIFDSWVGGLSRESYREYLMPHMKNLFSGLTELDIPVIHFGTGTALLLDLQLEAGGSVLGIDWRTPLPHAYDQLGIDVPLQGNLDPTLLLAPRDVLQRGAERVLSEARGAKGHIFNLGHGVLPQTPPENVEWLVDFVHNFQSS